MIEIRGRFTGAIIHTVDADSLSGADLSGAGLRGAYLRGAYLRGAYLGGAYLGGANLRGATVNWESHALIAELLRRAAGDSVERRSLAGLILVSVDWCHDVWAGLDHPARAWALGVLRGYVRDGDECPTWITNDGARDGQLDSVESGGGL